MASPRPSVHPKLKGPFSRGRVQLLPRLGGLPRLSKSVPLGGQPNNGPDDLPVAVPGARAVKTGGRRDFANEIKAPRWG